jgi:hypothetical protein
MRSAHRTMLRTLGGLVGLAVVLAAGVSSLRSHLCGQTQTEAAVMPLVSPSPPRLAVESPAEVPDYALLDTHDESSGDRARVSVEMVMDDAATPEEVSRALVHAAEAVRSHNPDLAAIMVTALIVDVKSDTALRRTGSLVWSPDGLGWDGTSQDDFSKHLFSEPAPER